MIDGLEWDLFINRYERSLETYRKTINVHPTDDFTIEELDIAYIRFYKSQGRTVPEPHRFRFTAREKLDHYLMNKNSPKVESNFTIQHKTYVGSSKLRDMLNNLKLD